MNRLTIFPIILVFCLHVNAVEAQRLPDSFSESLEQMDLLLSYPTEQQYRERSIRKNEWFEADFILQFKKRKKVEIQYGLVPESKEKNLIPQVHMMRMITHLGTNEEDYATIAIHRVNESDLIDQFNADWAKVSYFQPKRSFSRYQHCKMLSIYKEGKGMAYVLFLFNQPDEEVENQFYALKFG